ncbi:dehydratase [Actinomadura sp. LD22]|uniref:Dehydratase n=1 Tax=Actinomadura physcomitrii TaxID=2650748 RepID=A0A6I4M9K3_9ACTN|nr:MaoC/PaaZ C-terminal domain-containing protein [Actinomadura physcomitrii]MWA02888.1 dehydratase [Actinomadura physcomitrii]
MSPPSSRTEVEVRVGAELPALALPPISRADLALFAGASGDHNPIHIDLDDARAAGFDDVFAQGMLSMAYLGRLLTGWVPQDRIRSFEVRFTALTPVHAQPTCTGRVVAVDGGLATVDVGVTLADGTVTLTGQATIACESAAMTRTPERTLDEGAHLPAGRSS